MTDPVATATASPPSPDVRGAAARRLGRPADLQRGREHRPDRRPRSSRRCPDATLLVVDDGSPDGTGRLADAPRRRRPAHPRPPSGAEAGPRPRLPRRLRRRARRRRDDRRPDGRRLQPRPGGAAGPGRRRSPTATADLVIGSRYTKGGGVVDWGIGRRLVSRGGSLFARIVLGLGPERPDRRLQGVAGVDAGGRPVRRRPCRRLRLPDRDDVPGQPRRRAHPRGPDHVPRPPRRAVEDEPADRRRGAGRRRPAAGRGDRPEAAPSAAGGS